MSLRLRILGAFMLVVVLTVVITIGFAYWTTQRRLNVLVSQVNIKKGNELAEILSQQYSKTGGWETLEEILFRLGYFYDEGLAREWFGRRKEELGKLFDEKVRVVVVDVEGIVLVDGYSILRLGDVMPELGGQRATIVDLGTREPVGYAYVDVNPDYLAKESNDFLNDTLYTTAMGGLLTAAIALLLAAWLSKRITAPVTALIGATQAIAEQGDSQLLPVTSSDELGQMSAAFNQMTTALQTQRNLRQRLISDVSHELNTPLSVIRLEAKGLRDGLQTAEEAADQIIQEVDMLGNLVNDLNWLAETDSGELRLTLEPYSLKQLLTTEVERWQQQAQIHQITLSLQPLPTLPTLPILNLDKMRMSQALGNLLHNALQHTEAKADGHVTVAATLGSSATKSGKIAIITVTDNGVGIDSADLPHIFDRFYRTDHSRNRRTGGRGLGLAISRSIIEAHNGTIAIASNGLGQGTTVRFELPVDK